VSISKRQLQRLLTDKPDDFVSEAQDVLRAGLETSPFVSVDDTGARHAGKNGFCTQIGNDWFTRFATRSSKSRLNFLDLPRAGHTDYVLNDAAYGDTRKQGLPVTSIANLMAQAETRFADQAAWLAHLDRLGLTKLEAMPATSSVSRSGTIRAAGSGWPDTSSSSRSTTTSELQPGQPDRRRRQHFCRYCCGRC
jgi:hypothetical protein